jgi:hypothetical protein
VAKPLRFEDPWESMTWEGAAKANLIAGANLTLPEKLAWLEEINDLARNLARSRRRAGEPEAIPPCDEHRATEG